MNETKEIPETEEKPRKHPIDGGSYIRNEDGTRELIDCTGDRPCKCRPESLVAPAANVAAAPATSSAGAASSKPATPGKKPLPTPAIQE